MGRLPDFMIIGASRCGTSSLWKNLLQHPQIESSLKKEVHFFNKTKRYNRGIECYKDQFSNARKKALCFEASPAYFHESLSACRIFKHLPNGRFIILLRNPVDRVVSYYSRWKINEEQWNPPELMAINPCHGIVETGIYIKALWKWLGYFPRDRFLIIKSEDYFKNEKKIITQCFDWLGVESVNIGKPLFYDQRKRQEEWFPYQREVPDNVKDYLREFFKPHNLKLYELLDRDFGWQ